MGTVYCLSMQYAFLIWQPCKSLHRDLRSKAVLNRQRRHSGTKRWKGMPVHAPHCGQSLYYIEIAVDIPGGIDCGAGGDISDLFSIRKNGTKEYERSFCHTGRVIRTL